MSYGPITVYTVTMTSGALSSTAADLGRSWDRVYLEVPTMASGSLYLMGSSDNSTFRRVMLEQANTSTVVINTFSIDSAVTQRMVPVPAKGFRYVKVESSSGATDVVTTFKFICSSP